MPSSGRGVSARMGRPVDRNETFESPVAGFGRLRFAITKWGLSRWLQLPSLRLRPILMSLRLGEQWRDEFHPAPSNWSPAGLDDISRTPGRSMNGHHLQRTHGRRRGERQITGRELCNAMRPSAGLSWVVWDLRHDMWRRSHESCWASARSRRDQEIRRLVACVRPGACWGGPRWFAFEGVRNGGIPAQPAALRRRVLKSYLPASCHHDETAAWTVFWRPLWRCQ